MLEDLIVGCSFEQLEQRSMQSGVSRCRRGTTTGDRFDDGLQQEGSASGWLSRETVEGKRAHLKVAAGAIDEQKEQFDRIEHRLISGERQTTGIEEHETAHQGRIRRPADRESEVAQYLGFPCCPGLCRAAGEYPLGLVEQ